MADPIVTVVVPAYNAATTLAETIQSLQAQSLLDWEAVVVDDGSRDTTGELADRFAAIDSRISVVHQENRGEAGARNTALSVARAPWLVFLDADDWLLPAHLERLTAAAASSPDLDVVHCGWVRVAQDGVQGPPAFAPAEPDLFPELARYNCLAVHACLVRRHVVDRIGGFDPVLKTCSDWDLWQRVARTGARFGAVREVLACYRLTPSSAGTMPAQILADGFAVISRGHRADPRVSRPHADYAYGLTPTEEPAAKLTYLCWAAGMAIGVGEDARALLARAPAIAPAGVAAQKVADLLFASVPLPSGRLPDAWPTLWPIAEPLVDVFLAAFEPMTACPGLAESAKIALVRKIQVQAANDASACPQRERRIAELETAKQWHEHQAAHWARVAAEQNKTIADLQSWVRQLEEAKAWLDEQRHNWHRIAEERARELLPLQSRPASPSTAVHGVQFGDLRRLQPISTQFGFDRGLPVDRYYIEGFLDRHASHIRGRVLEIGDNTYTRRFGGDRVHTSDVLHVDARNPNATIIGDVASADHIPSGTFDCIVFTQTLQLVYDVAAGLRTLHRVLRPGGVLLATFPGITQLSDFEWRERWYWAFTPWSARRLFGDVFGDTKCSVETHGNVLAAIAFLQGLAAEELTREELDHLDIDYPVTIAVVAQR